MTTAIQCSSPNNNLMSWLAPTICGLAKTDYGRRVTGLVPTGRLSTLERDLLKDALAVVRHFESVVRHQMHISV